MPSFIGSGAHDELTATIPDIDVATRGHTFVLDHAGNGKARIEFKISDNRRAFRYRDQGAAKANRITVVVTLDVIPHLVDQAVVVPVIDGDQEVITRAGQLDLELTG